jgi:predicted choloylglycine hydrolase
VATSDGGSGKGIDWSRLGERIDWSDWRSWLKELSGVDWAALTPRAPRRPEQPAPGPIELTLGAWAEDEPGDKHAEQIELSYPALREWWLREGGDARTPSGEAGERLAEHMPELVPTWRRLTEMVDDEHASAVLALWNPPAFLTGCSQAAVPGRSPALVRNYDWDYRLYDGVVMRTAYGGRRVLGMGDCLWGLLDGVNDAGIAVSLTFGGRPNVGTGFGIPIVLRYVLQTSDAIDAAVDALTRIPVHMSYNVTVLDAEGRHATVYVAPDRPARVTNRAVTTNHQGKVEWKPYAAAIRSVERSDRLDALLGGGADTATVITALLREPMYATKFHDGFGTLYTAEYRPGEGSAIYHWPERTWEHSIDGVAEETVHLLLGDDRPDARATER